MKRNILMKRNVLCSIVALMVGITTATACVPRLTLPQITGYVMDSTQALLPHAEVQIGKTVVKTSWDGRFIVPAGRWPKNGKIEVRCEGYEKQRVALSSVDTVAPLFIVLKSDGKHLSFKDDIRPKKMLGGSGVLYSKAESADYATAAMRTSVMADVAEDMVVGYAAPVYNTIDANDAAAGQLTAGEVNDFAKWALWAGILDGSHQQYVSDWRITPRHRYVVQVTTQSGQPIASRAVSLLDNSGNTLYQAVTDNTGKAELWYQLTGNNLCGKHAGLRIRVDEQEQVARDWSEGMNVFRLSEPCAHSDAVDVLFVFDATGSMGDELRYLQAEMKDVIARAKEATGGLQIRTGAVVYRDHSDEYVTRISRLTDEIGVTQSFIDKQSAGGGGDYPEAVPEALMAALNGAGWDSDARARIAFLILDAPCHKDSLTIALLHEQLLNAAALGVRVVPVVCSGVDESGELLMRSIALATNGTSFFLTDDSGIGDTHLKPTTDSLKVEHLNDMLVRTIAEFSAMPACAGADQATQMSEEETFVPNPFEAEDLDSAVAVLPLMPVDDVLRVQPNPCTAYCTVDLPQGAEALWLVDISGKSIRSLGRFAAPATGVHVEVSDLATGVYFVKAFVGGRWYTRKLIVQ